MGSDGARGRGKSHGGDDVQSLDLLASETALPPVEMGHPARMKRSARENKSDKIDGRTISDLLRCTCCRSFVISPELGALRQQLRFRRLMIEQQVSQEQTAGLLMEQEWNTSESDYRQALFRRFASPERVDRKTRCGRCWNIAENRSRFARHGPAAAADVGSHPGFSANRVFTR